MKIMTKLIAVVLIAMIVFPIINAISVSATNDTLNETYSSLAYGYKDDSEEWVESLFEKSGAYHTSIRNIGLTKLREINDTLLTAVDITTDARYGDFFPPIGNQHQAGACTCFATTYYQFTYEANRLDNIQTTKSNTFCPQWNYSILSNGNKSNGTNFKENYDVINYFGAIKYSDYDDSCFVNNNISGNYDFISDDFFTGYWNNSTTAHYSSFGKKVIEIPLRFERPSTGIYITFGNGANETDLSLVEIKQELNKGKLITFSANYDYLNVGKIIDDTYGEVITQVPYADNGHALTIVGYDDDVEVDINGNNVIESWERGAFKIANSWGTDHGNDGFVWVMYDAINLVSVGGIGSWNITNRASFFRTCLGPINEQYSVLYEIEVINVPTYICEKIEINTSNKYQYQYQFSLNHTDNTLIFGRLFDFHNSWQSPPNILYTSFNGSLLIDYNIGNDIISSIFNDCIVQAGIESNANMAILDLSEIISVSVTDNNGNIIDSVPYEDMTIPLLNPRRLVSYLNASTIKGDLDYNGVLNNDDKALLTSMVVGNTDFSDLQFFLGDVNCDGSITAKDISALRKLINGEQFNMNDLLEDDETILYLNCYIE